MNANGNNRVLSALAAALAIGGMALLAQQNPGRPATRPAGAEPEYEAQEKAIRQTAEAFTQAFNRGDAKALAAMWTREGEYVDEAGRVTTGRAAIEKEFAAFFKAQPKRQMRVMIESIRFLGPTIAVEEGTSRLSEPSIGDTSTARYTVLHVKEDGQWLMASVRDHESATLSNYEKLRDLDSLIGDWTVRGKNGRVETSCEWMENRNFIRRTFTTYRDDKVIGSGFEIIGIDPSLGHIVSWHFSDDGGVGHSIWRKRGDRWTIQASGTMPDGRSTFAINILTPVDRDTFTWSSYDRAVEGEPVQDTPIATIARNKK
jgi:uncharacterized protein (TIGR02246 family)